jgi:asparagine synthase (glutamine-hydrolysing)
MMYKFLLKLNTGVEAKAPGIFNVKSLPGHNALDGLYIVSPANCITIDYNNILTILLGDIIIPDKEKTSGLEHHVQIKEYFKKLKGTFYVLRLNLQERSFEVASSIFGIFPVYYLVKDQEIIISSEINGILASARTDMTVNKRFILEKLLFYYPLFDHTIFSEIRNLPANSVLTIKGNDIAIEKYLFIAEQFLKDPLPYHKYTSLLSDLFISNVREYFPDEPFFITFTGGFDGRTLVACAKNAGKDFKTYSIGDKTLDDVTIPLADAAALNIEHIPFYLDNTEYKQQFLELGKNVLRSSGLMNNMLYTHFPYVASTISEQTNFILTGFGGSEIFRALDIRGAVTSHELVDFFEFSKTSEWKDKIRSSRKLDLLNKNLFSGEIDSLISDLSDYQSQLDKSAGLNERIYIYLYEEVFRKVFGPTINSMFNYAVIRNPYFDYAFNSELLKYSIAGVYSKFLVKNPAKRLKGQVLYGHIINKTSKILAGRKTGKGYRPGDLISYYGLLNITINFIKKKLLRKISKENLDFFSLVSGIEQNKSLYLDLIHNSKYFNDLSNKNFVSDRSYLNGIKERDLILLSFSIIQYIKMYYEKDLFTH